jgi:hypothetical protein
MYFTGQLGHGKDHKRAAGGFIHGMRYVSRALFRVLESKYRSNPRPQAGIGGTKAGFAEGTGGVGPTDPIRSARGGGGGGSARGAGDDTVLAPPTRAAPLPVLPTERRGPLPSDHTSAPASLGHGPSPWPASSTFEDVQDWTGRGNGLGATGCNVGDLISAGECEAPPVMRSPFVSVVTVFPSLRCVLGRRCSFIEITR